MQKTLAILLKKLNLILILCLLLSDISDAFPGRINFHHDLKFLLAPANKQAQFKVILFGWVSASLNPLEVLALSIERSRNASYR